MCTWQELCNAVQSRFKVLGVTSNLLRAIVLLPEGQQQEVSLRHSVFTVDEDLSEPFVIVFAPVVEYSDERAMSILRNADLPITATDDDMLSIVHHLHYDGLDTDRCLRIVEFLAATADMRRREIEGSHGSMGSGAGSAPDTAASGTRTSGVLGTGEWIVGKDVLPGLYRFSGYVARRDKRSDLIDNYGARKGLGLMRVFPHDSYIEVSGELIGLEDLPVYDVLEEGPRGGMYLAGVDLPFGRYRIHGDGSFASYSTYDHELEHLDTNYNQRSVVLNLDDSVFAIDFTGRIEPLP